MTTDAAPLDQAACLALAAELPDVPVNTIPIGALRLEVAQAYRHGGSCLVVLSGEGTGYGTVEEIWPILKSVEDCTCILLPTQDANALAGMMSTPVRFVDDIQYVLPGDPVPFSIPGVRLVDPSTFAPDVYGDLFPDVDVRLLPNGVVACAFVNGVPIAEASCLFRSDTFADIGVRTLEPFRGRGFATAAASTVAAELRTQGLRPVWSTSTDNVASRRVAEKLGFERISMQRFVVPEGARWL